MTRFLLAWIVPAWIVFEAVPTKLPHYTLPLYPAVALLTDRWMLDPSRGPSPRWLSRLSLISFTVCASIIGLGLAALPFVAAPGIGPLDLLGLPSLTVAAMAAWWVPRVARQHRWRATAWAALLAAPLLYWSSLGLELPGLTPLWIAPRVSAALAAHWPNGRPPNARFGAAGFSEPSLMVMCGTDTRWLYGGADAARFLAAGPDRVVAVGDRDVGAFRAEATKLRIAPHGFDEVAGYNYSRGRRVTLSLFDLAH